MAFSRGDQNRSPAQLAIRFGEISIQYSSRLGENEIEPVARRLSEPGLSGQEAFLPMTISAIVPVWNGRELLERLLASLAAQTQRADELLVVDNGSDDGAPEVARAAGARVIAMGRNAGFAAAVNRGIRESRGEWIAMLNSDVELAPDYFEKLSATDGWFATGKILRPRGQHASMAHSMLLSRAGTAWRVGSGRIDGPLFSEPRTICSAPWTAALFRAELSARWACWRRASNLTSKMWISELRCACGGFEGCYVPGAVAWHRGSATLGRWHPGHRSAYRPQPGIPAGAPLSGPVTTTIVVADYRRANPVGSWLPCATARICVVPGKGGRHPPVLGSAKSNIDARTTSTLSNTQRTNDPRTPASYRLRHLLEVVLPPDQGWDKVTHGRDRHHHRHL